MKKLPSIYKNSVEKSTNKKVFYSAQERNLGQEITTTEEVENLVRNMDASNVAEALDILFQRRKHAYTDEVEITTADRIYQTRLVFMTNEKLVTIDNEEIYLDDIISIQI